MKENVVLITVLESKLVRAEYSIAFIKYMGLCLLNILFVVDKEKWQKVYCKTTIVLGNIQIRLSK